MYRGDLVGCQLFSEPGAGSDLAGLQTKAERDGDEWVITGQKVWTSGAQYSDIGEIICRTDPDLPKHKGLTGFVVDMQAPGVEVRPLRQMTGGASFNEVFFNEVRVPDDHRLGDVNQGWTVALTTLHERAGLDRRRRRRRRHGRLGNVTRLIADAAPLRPRPGPVYRQELAKVYTGFQVAKCNNQRAMDKIKAGQLPGPEMSIAKMALTNNLLAVSRVRGRRCSARGSSPTPASGAPTRGAVRLGMPGMRVAGGTDEVLRNIVGERVLGLPKDPGIDTTSPFKDLLKN